jgi:uncharacterized damage-inducible protein DinB
MITPVWCGLMAAYNTEMNRRVFAAADRLQPAQREADRGAFFGSIQATLNHLLWGDRVWMHRFAGWKAPAGGIQGSVRQMPDWPSLQAARRETDTAIEAWASGLDMHWLRGSLSWHSASTGQQMTRPAWVLVTHFFNHQTHHRGQVHALLTGFGQQTGDTDLPFVLPAEAYA